MALDKNVTIIVDRKKEWVKWFNENYGNQIEEVYRAVKCMTKPIYVLDSNGKETSQEDTSRTNVSMPELSLIRRRKVARLTANTPQYKVTCPIGSSEDLAARLSALFVQLYDRSGEAIEQRRLVDQGITFGWACSVLYWDYVEVTRQLRYNLLKLTDRSRLMQIKGAPPDEIQQAVQELGPQLQDAEIQQAIAQLGSKYLTVQKPTTKYEGPCVHTPFIGDVWMEQGARCLNDSAWFGRQFYETDLWLQKFAKLTYVDNETGQEVQAADPQALQELVDDDAFSTQGRESEIEQLKSRLRGSISQSEPLIEKRLLNKKKFLIYEQQAMGDDGRIWYEYIGNEKHYLGKRPMPWDFYGKFSATEFVPLPDYINAIGDSTPRLLRFVHALHNAGVGMRKDYVRNALKPLVKVRANEDIPEQMYDRGQFRVLKMKDPSAVVYEQLPPLPPGAWEEENQEMRMIALAEPSMNNVEAGSQANPQAGKTATTAILAAKSSDALTQFELDGLNLYLKEKQEKTLWMMQQQVGADQYDIQPQFVTEALTERYGKTAVISVDQNEMQEDLQVEPVAGSMLAVDDQIKQGAAQDFFNLANTRPDIFDVRYAAENLAGTIRGIDRTKAIQPPAPPKPPIDKVTLALTGKVDVPAGVQQAMWSQIPGAPPVSPETVAKGAADTLEHVSRAADALNNLSSSPTDEGAMRASEAQAKRVGG